MKEPKLYFSLRRSGSETVLIAKDDSGLFEEESYLTISERPDLCKEVTKLRLLYCEFLEWGKEISGMMVKGEFFEGEEEKFEAVKKVGVVWMLENLDGTAEARIGVSIHGSRQTLNTHPNPIEDPYHQDYGKHFVSGCGNTDGESVEAMEKQFRFLCEKHRPIENKRDREDR